MAVFTHLLYNIPFWGRHFVYWENSVMMACTYDVLKHVEELLTYDVYILLHVMLVMYINF